jgi:hypothetical protein
MPASTYFRRLTGFRKPVEHTGQRCPRAWPMTPHSRGYGGPFATPPAIHLENADSELLERSADSTKYRWGRSPAEAGLLALLGGPPQVR